MNKRTVHAVIDDGYMIVRDANSRRRLIKPESVSSCTSPQREQVTARRAVELALNARANGTLMTRQEFIDSLDIDAAILVGQTWEGDTSDLHTYIKAIVVAALGDPDE